MRGGSTNTTVEGLRETSWTADGVQTVDPEGDSGLLCLIAAARQLKRVADLKQVWHVFGRKDVFYDEMDILRCAGQLNLQAKSVKVETKDLLGTPAPAIVARRGRGQFCLVTRIGEDGMTVHNPIEGRTRNVAFEDFLTVFTGDIILIGKNRPEKRSDKPFGLSWFVPTVMKHVIGFRRVIIASLVLQCMALAWPKLFEVIIDKVLVNRGLQSLDVLAVALVAIVFFEPLMTFFRSLVFAHIASCVNSELSARLFRHLVYLPLGYFGSRLSGEVIARVREMDNIRNFLTGSALMMVIDLVFVGVFLAVMYVYSPRLTLIVVISLLVFLMIWIAVAPFLRKRVEAEYERNAENTAFLTEAVTGMETVKSLGAGRQFREHWEEKLSAHLKASFRTSTFGIWAGGTIGLVQKIFNGLILWFGVHLVIDGKLTLGQLVAFNMLSNHVTMPILRLAQIWQDFQHTGVSIKRLGDILDEKPEAETSAGRSSLGRVRGEIELRKVTFRYKDDGREVLRHLDLHIPAGQKIGITGLSGSGKSTITKLVQRLYVPQSGQVLVDGVDLVMADPAMLRQSMGVILQENFLFNGSIKDNILIGKPSAGEGDVMRAAALAGAHQFISELPYGYDTQVGERGGNLSGGQRQRVAIARALISDPAILIFDEATSALDYESEAEVLRQLPDVLEGRTALIIAHRLNSMTQCDRVIVMEHGGLIEDGSHEELLEKGGRYAELWNLQHRA
ncbi:type I secretion system permease/ATPase [Coralliovum pocilloporae]|uniref:type I secretion system permease/ATPase n=1 Tax=Coralliovum pocilloporae TaxID=3066369 RepID=UPI003306BEBC